MRTPKPKFQIAILFWRLFLGLGFLFLSTYLGKYFAPEMVTVIMAHLEQFVGAVLLLMTGVDLENYARVLADWRTTRAKEDEEATG